MNIIFVIVCVSVFFIILYFVVKAAVRGGIVEARHIRDKQDESEMVEGNTISQTTCPSCGKRHDIDYPKCPYCKHRY